MRNCPTTYKAVPSWWPKEHLWIICKQHQYENNKVLADSHPPNFDISRLQTGTHHPEPKPRGLLTVAGDSVKAWLDDELVFDEVLKQINN